MLNWVNEIDSGRVAALRQKLYFDKNQLACILTVEGNKLKAWLLIYEFGFEGLLFNDCTISCDSLLDGIVCDWKNRKNYRYLEFLKEKGFIEKFMVPQMYEMFRFGGSSVKDDKMGKEC